eukprot:gene12073-12163_t
MTIKLPKVAVCFPSGDMVHADFALSLAGMLNTTHPLDTPIINNKSSIVAVARNNGVAHALEMQADYMLFLDSDMTFPRDTLYRLLTHQRDIVGATYTKRVPPFDVLGAVLEAQPKPDARGLIEMRHLPTGCLMIRMSVFAALPKPYFRFLTNETTGEIHGEDYVFCDHARAAGFKIWCDATLSHEIGHIGQQICKIPQSGKRTAGREGANTGPQDKSNVYVKFAQPVLARCPCVWQKAGNADWFLRGAKGVSCDSLISSG